MCCSVNHEISTIRWIDNEKLILQRSLVPSWTKTGSIAIYGDDILLYSAELSEYQTSVDFTVDVSGVQYLKVELHSGRGTGGYAYTALVNAYLS